MSDPKVIYLGPECEDEFCDGRTWADHVAWPDCDCKHKPVRYNLGSDYDAALACEAALREENKLLRHDIASYLETTAKVCELLGIDVDSAKNAEGKPSDVLFAHAQKLNADLSALREELERAKSRYDREVLGLNNECDPIGGDPAGGYKNDLARVNSAFDELAASVGFSEARLDQTGDSPVDCANQLQQRLTDAEKRVAELDSAAREMLRIAGIANQGSKAYNRAIINLHSTLNPAEGEGS